MGISHLKINLKNFLEIYFFRLRGAKACRQTPLSTSRSTPQRKTVIVMSDSLLIYHVLQGLQERIARIFILTILVFLLSGVLRLVLETGWTHLACSHHFSPRCNCQLLNELLEFFHHSTTNLPLLFASLLNFSTSALYSS